MIRSICSLIILPILFRPIRSAVMVGDSGGRMSSDEQSKSINDSFEDNTIDSHRHVDCGTIATNITKILVKNPNHPEPTFTKAICETVIERAHPAVTKLKVKFNQLEIYRPTADGQCLHDRFAIYTDLNAAVTPVLCGNQTGKTIWIPFVSPQASLIISVSTSDLDYDRLWSIEVEQEK